MTKVGVDPNHREDGDGSKLEDQSGLRKQIGYFFTREAQQYHASGPFEEYDTGEKGALPASSPWFSIPAASKGFARQAGYRSAQAFHRCVRSRVFLASTCGMLQGFHSGCESGLLVAQIQQNRGTRPKKPAGASSKRLERNCRVGVRTPRHPPACRPAGECCHSA